MELAPATRRQPTFRSLSIPNYRRWVAGQFVSVTGLSMQQVGQAWLVIERTGSGLAAGVALALQFLPMLLFGMWGGLLADRTDKRRLLLATQLAAAGLALALWGLVATGAVELWMVYVLAFLTGCVHAADMPARHSFVAEMVGPSHMTNAVGLNSAVFNAGRLVGPAVAGVLIAWVGVGVCFLANGLSYLALVAALRAMRPGDLHPQPLVSREPGQVREALRYVWHTTELRRTLLMVAVVGTLGFNFVVILPLLAREDLGGGARMFGALSSVMGLGSLAGALVTASRARPTRRVQVSAAAAFGLLTALAAATSRPLVVAAMLAASGLCVMVFLATANASLQLASAPAMRGRVMSLYGLVFLGSTPVGGPLMGWIAQQWGARAALVVAGGACLAAGLVAAAADRRPARAASDGRTPAGSGSTVAIEAA